MASPSRPASPRLFLVDGYALIYRAFYALISRPLTTARGENTSAAWGVVNFLQRLRSTHQPDYLGWVHDSGRSFRHQRYPAYKATRQKLSEELQSDFDRGMERIRAILEASRIPNITLDGYEADNVIGALARQAVEQGVNVVIVSGDKDFQQLVRPGIWLLNPGRGGPANVEEHWVSVENAEERLGVPPRLVTDYLAMVGDSSDNVPGVPGVGEKTARELVQMFGPLESILAHAAELTKKRPREALQQFADRAVLSKELVTIRDDLPISLDLESLRVREPDTLQLREIYIELEFHTLARDLAVTEVQTKAPIETKYRTLESVANVQALVRRARGLGHFALDTKVVVEPESPLAVDALRSSLVGLSIALAPGEAYYLPLAHRDPTKSGASGPDAIDAGRVVERPEGLVVEDETDLEAGVGVVAGTGELDLGIGSAPAPASARRRSRAASAAAEASDVSEEDGDRTDAVTTRAAGVSIAAQRIAAGGLAPVRNLPSLTDPENAAPSRAARGSLSPQDGAEREVRRAGVAAGGTSPGGSRLRPNARELRARPWTPVPRARRPGARVSRTPSDDVRGPMRQGQG